MTGALTTLWFAAMKTENLCRARRISLSRSTFYIALVKGITNTYKHKCKCNRLLVTHPSNNANANAFQMISIKFAIQGTKKSAARLGLRIIFGKYRLVRISSNNRHMADHFGHTLDAANDAQHLVIFGFVGGFAHDVDDVANRLPTVID